MDDAICITGIGGTTSPATATTIISISPHEEDNNNLSSEQRRKQFAFHSSGRSYSAPPRKKWYRRGPLRRMGSQHSMLYDRMVSRRLVGAIAAWHDLHSTLLQLSCDKKSQCGSSEICTFEGTPVSSDSPSPSDEVFSSDDYGESDDELYALSDNDNRVDIDEDDEDGAESDDTIDEIVELGSKSKLNKKLSLSNPELTSIQLKQMFPELSEHWRLVLSQKI
uniref:Uncharacterized protein n=1 Tax=Panagrolaimus sp. PS1159 TaxID=55785 RepID=A0AC35FUN8_9BILA